MTLEELYALLNYFEKSSIGSLEVEMADFHVKVNKNVSTNVLQSAQVVPLATEEKNTEVQTAAVPIKNEVQGVEVTAPLVGIFYEASSPEAEALAPLGSIVKKGQVIGLIESMKMFNDVLAPVDGVIEKISVSNGAMVEYGTILFEIKEAAYV